MAETTHDILRRRLLSAAGVFAPARPVDLEAQWDNGFECLMRNRMKMGSMRYGHFRSKRVRPEVRLSSIHKRLARYVRTGNLECLVDIANLCMIEFCTSTHPARHFRAVDGDEAEATRVRYAR